jgi:acyl-CoA synthetase (AMP-forming)/AMP-acid ligase II
LEKGDVVTIFMKNRLKLLAIFTAVAKVGAISSMINTELRKKSLIYCLNLTPGKFTVIGEACFDLFNDVRSELDLSTIKELYFVPDQGAMPIPSGFDNLPEVVNNSPVNNPSSVADVHNNDPIAYVFTSGTTGLPKAAIVPHYKMTASGYLFGEWTAQLTSDDIFYICLPFFHSTALQTSWSACFATGAAVAVGRKFSVSHFWDEIRKYKATGFSYVGEICRYLMNQPPSPDDLNNSVRSVIGNGLRPEIWLDFKKRFGIERIGEFYGSSEGNGAFVNTLNFDCTTGTTTGMYAIVKYDIENDTPIYDEKNHMRKVKPGETGLVIFKNVSPQKFRGYTDKKATEKKIFHNVFIEGDEWLNMGDLMRDQGCKHAQFVDRLGDTFRWKGHNVSTTEVEEVFNVHDQVEMSCVYGVQIPNTDGRAGMTVIVPIGSVEEFNLKDLVINLRQNLADFAIPIFLRFKSEISTTATYKLKKQELKVAGFDIGNIDDAIYVMLPNELDYQPLTKEIYENILNQKYKF